MLSETLHKREHTVLFHLYPENANQSIWTAGEWLPWPRRVCGGLSKKGREGTLGDYGNFSFLFLAVPHGMPGLSSPTRDRTRALCSGSAES